MATVMITIFEAFALSDFDAGAAKCLCVKCLGWDGADMGGVMVSSDINVGRTAAAANGTSVVVGAICTSFAMTFVLLATGAEVGEILGESEGLKVLCMMNRNNNCIRSKIINSCT